MRRASAVLLAAALALGAACGPTADAGAARAAAPATPPAQGAPAPAASGAPALVIAEPTHGLGYLPLYVANRQGYLAEEGLAADVLTLAGGSAHTNAVLTGQAWAFIGGPEHNAFAKAKGAIIKAIVNVVDRGNVYFVARPGETPAGGDLASFMRGKRIITGLVGGTPHSITLSMLKRLGLDPGRDVTLLEMENAAMLPAMQRGAGDVAITSEPALSQGKNNQVWGEPIYNVPREFGPYAYSTINVRADSLAREPATAERFVRAMLRALRALERDRDLAYRVARQEFPTLSEADIDAMLTRTYADALWRFDGDITPEAVATALDVVTHAGLLKEAIAYDDIVDLRFQRAALAALP
jgi:NitT/TauT family transport system substrate-binding protein